MKKILTTVLCMGILTTPCFACGGPNRNHPAPMNQPPRIEKTCHGCNFNHTYYGKRNHTNGTTAALATVAGVAGLAAIITAVAN